MLKPLADKILVKPSKAEEVSKGGIVLPDTAKKKPVEGEVVAVGPGKLLEKGQRVPPDIKVGDIVIYTEYGGTEITVGTEDYVILDELSVLAVRDKPKKSKTSR
ncbi:MAG: co-chaperone GroES [Armatimonadetes bacterium]|nr:co-chaperone GroES [Armatimonadota bacterium]NIM24176.1 co-chaperone GroES [Armatimonadota bacterium]NIM68035.1 co-chaperone GroES [Armatimonadota bacterium]NIM76530.1 co-chaperone GroES [Armatimonadota bacterium]NIN06269.1 co-chaperone GroES [Armatimonadota bacterium]